MTSAKGRKLNVGDMMILVVATAIGSSTLTEQLRFLAADGGQLAKNWNWRAYLIGILPLWLCGTVASLIIRLRQPRPNFRRLCRQPGFVAGISAATCATVVLSCDVLNGLRDRGLSWPLIDGITFLGWPRHFGPAVLGAWSLLAISGRWRSERSSIDRIGTFLGFGWIVCWVALKLA